MLERVRDDSVPQEKSDQDRKQAQPARLAPEDQDREDTDDQEGFPNIERRNHGHPVVEKRRRPGLVEAVSYTHLTPPTGALV